MKKVHVQPHGAGQVELTADIVFNSAGEGSAKPEVKWSGKVDKYHMVDSVSVMEPALASKLTLYSGEETLPLGWDNYPDHSGRN